MSRFQTVALHHASRLINHGPTVLITSVDAQVERRNIMAAAWIMGVEFQPPRVAVVIDKSAWSRELIERSGQFGIVVPGADAARWTYAVGSVSGRDEDKFNAYGIPTVSGPVLGLPLVEEKCLAWMECRLLPATAAAEKYDMKWSRPPPMERRLSPAAGSSTTINALRCIISAPGPSSPAAG